TENEICLKFGTGEGDIHAIADIAEWIMHVTAQLARLLDLKGAKEATELEKRIHYGAGPELMNLLDIRGTGRVRARKLYEAGFRSISELAGDVPEKIAALLGPKIADMIFKQVGSKEEINKIFEPESLERSPSSVQKTISDF